MQYLPQSTYLTESAALVRRAQYATRVWREWRLGHLCPSASEAHTQRVLWAASNAAYRDLLAWEARHAIAC